MIIKEEVCINNDRYIHIYSDTNKYLIQIETKEIFEDILDNIDSEFTYIESRFEIKEDEDISLLYNKNEDLSVST